MAVADLAVEMGPRSRRRLAKGAIALVVIAAIVLGFVLLNRPPDSGPATVTGSSRGSSTPLQPKDVTAKLVYGMSKQQVLHRVGKPTKTLRDQSGLSCWQYNENRKFQGPDGHEHIQNAVRVCFLSGLYTIAYPELDGKWVYSLPKPGVGS